MSSTENLNRNYPEPKEGKRYKLLSFVQTHYKDGSFAHESGIATMYEVDESGHRESLKDLKNDPSLLSCEVTFAYNEVPVINEIYQVEKDASDGLFLAGASVGCVRENIEWL